MLMTTPVTPMTTPITCRVVIANLLLTSPSLCRSRTLVGSFQINRLVFASDDGRANFLHALSFFSHLVGKENLLDTKRSTGAVLGRITIKQAPVAELIAMAITGLLS